MLRNIRETRLRNKEGIYESTLEISEKDFFEAYEEIDNDSAKEVLSNYLMYKEDDARAHNISVNHDKNRHMVQIKCELNYLGNSHTDYR